MTNTEALAPAKWATSSLTAKPGYTKVYELLRVEAPADEVRALFQAMTEIRGAHRVELTRQHGEYVDGKYIESPWFSIYFRGTDRAVRVAAGQLAVSGLQNLDPNADHDHAACIARAAEMGVPAWSAHTPETYLSS
jgi:hypothetical protein